MKNSTFATAVIATSLLFTKPIHAQEDEIASPPVAASAQVNNDGIMSRLEATEREIQSLKKQNSDLSTQVTEMHEAENQTPAEVPNDLGKTRVFGFYDMSFGKQFTSSGGMSGNNIPDKMTFMLSGLNVYMGNQITEKLKFLSELRFTYQPLGYETFTAKGYSRTDTTVTDSSSLQTYRLGGVSIERVQTTYVFSDYLGVTAGSFLTPYGIWNVDHGTPVLIMCRAPGAQIMEFVPSKQLGIQIFGKVFFAKNFTFDYAGTISNGRGPMDTVYDLDNNKGIGLRWKLSYEKDDFSAAIGQYGYTGKYTDVTKSQDMKMNTVVTPTNQYTEYDLANDLLIKFHGLRLQSEAVFKEVKYAVPPASGQDYSASYLAHTVYGLLAYELPESWTGGKVRIMPYIYEEWINTSDISTMGTLRVNVAGINIRPYTNLVLKLEYLKVGSDLQSLTSQLAVTF
jgi:hypothetical protein